MQPSTTPDPGYQEQQQVDMKHCKHKLSDHGEMAAMCHYITDIPVFFAMLQKS